MTRAIASILLLSAIPLSAAIAGDVSSYLPRDNAVRGWTRKGEARLFVSSRLWEYIDGGADVYIDFGFLRVATVELRNDTRNIVADIYEFRSPEGAFGMYARERAPTYTFSSFGAEGYQEGVALNFYQDKYYIKLTAFSDDAQTKLAMPKLAQAISRAIGSSSARPAMLALLPDRNREKHTETFEAKSWLSSTALREAWTARYTLGGKKCTFFLCAAGNASAAKTRFQGLRSLLTATGSFDKRFDGLGDALLTGRHKEAGEVLFLLKGKFICGIYPAQEEAKGFLQAALAKLK